MLRSNYDGNEDKIITIIVIATIIMMIYISTSVKRI